MASATSLRIADPMRRPHRDRWSQDFRRPRPPWWPENEAWPPRGRWPMHRGPFFRRVGCFFALLSVLGGAFLLSVGGWLLNILGITHSGQSAWVLPIAVIA